MMHETFWTLLGDPAHWAFELFLMVVFDGVILGICWPFIRKHWKHHVDRDQAEKKKDGTELLQFCADCNDTTGGECAEHWALIYPSHWPGKPPFTGDVKVQVTEDQKPNEWTHSTDGWDSWG